MTAASEQQLRAAIAAIPDPEVPVITIQELGILRGIEVFGTKATVTITPTYSGCPAMDYIEDEITRVAADTGHEVEVRMVYSPAWTTEWITEEAREKLREFGIAGPRRDTSGPVLCPQCSSESTSVISAFGSTACKALMVCSSCGEPFDHFKEH